MCIRQRSNNGNYRVASLFFHNHVVRSISLSVSFVFDGVRALIAHMYFYPIIVSVSLFSSNFFVYFSFVILCRHHLCFAVRFVAFYTYVVRTTLEYRCQRSFQSELSIHNVLSAHCSSSCLHYSAIMYTNQNPSDMYNYSAVFIRKRTLMRKNKKTTAKQRWANEGK